MTRDDRPARGGGSRHAAPPRRSADDPQAQTTGEGRRASAWRQQPSRARTGQSNYLYMLIPAVVVIAFGLLGVWYIGNARSGAPGGEAQSGANEQAALLSDVVWPSYVARGSQAVKEAYEFAVLRPDVLQYMPCYCGCGGHDGHKSNAECFVDNMNQGGRTIAFDNHGSA